MQISMDKKYRTRGGRQVRILCVNLRSSRPVCAAIYGDDVEMAIEFYADGRVSLYGDDHLDLVEVSPYEDFKTDDPVMVRVADDRWLPRYFSHVKDGKAFCFLDGRTSWTCGDAVSEWGECRRPTPEELAGKSV